MFKILAILVLSIPFGFSKRVANSQPIPFYILGDSLTEGYGVAKEDAYPQVLNQLLRSQKLNYQILSFGESGSTTASGVGRIKKIKPKTGSVFMIALGANDGLRGTDAKVTENNLRAMIVELKKTPDIKIIIASMMAPPNYGPSYSKEFNGIFKKVAQQQRVFSIPFFLAQVAGRPELNIEDGIHPNSKGHKLVAEEILKSLKGIL